MWHPHIGTTERRASRPAKWARTDSQICAPQSVTVSGSDLRQYGRFEALSPRCAVTCCDGELVIFGEAAFAPLAETDAELDSSRTAARRDSSDPRCTGGTGKHTKCLSGS
jgi:hypothetical protein